MFSNEVNVDGFESGMDGCLAEYENILDGIFVFKELLIFMKGY